MSRVCWGASWRELMLDFGQIFRNEIPVDSTNCWNHSVESLSSKSFILIKPMEMFKTQLPLKNMTRWMKCSTWLAANNKKKNTTHHRQQLKIQTIFSHAVKWPTPPRVIMLTWAEIVERGVSSCPGCKLHPYPIPLFKTRKRMCSKGGKVLKTSRGWVGVCVEFQVHLKCNCVQGQCNVFVRDFHAENVAPNCYTFLGVLTFISCC